MTTQPKLTVLTNLHDQSLSEGLLNELRAVILKTEYDHVRFATLIGVLEMLKVEMFERQHT